MDRRNFLKSSAMGFSGLVLAGPMTAPFEIELLRRPRRNGIPLAPVADEVSGLELLQLPKGFSYRTFGWTGDLMNDGTLTPDRHDGMAIVRAEAGNRLVLLRNHERGASAGDNPLPVIGDANTPTYDRFQAPPAVSGIGGGVTAVVWENGRFVDARAALAGTLTNCAGGPTPWGTWLTCEETTIRGSAVGARDHGYVYEVPSPFEQAASANPIIEMGFYDHEALAIDAATGFVYLTEDNGPACGTYRFRPNDPTGAIGALEAGGVLEMLKVVGVDNADLGAVLTGDTFQVEWVPIADPNADPEGFESPAPGFPPISGIGKSGCYLQGEALGGARFVRGEGAWAHDGQIYFVDTSGGPSGDGAVWAYRPGNDPLGGGELKAVFVANNEGEADSPDNITLTPGGIPVLCEDGGGQRGVDGTVKIGARLLALSPRGEAFPVAVNNVVVDAAIPQRPFIAPGDYRGAEFAGATFSPDGRTLFVNIQTPGITFAITGPWENLVG